MGLVWEVWTRPGDANFGRVIDGLPISSAYYHAGMDEIGDGGMQVPNTYDRFDEILSVDEATPSNTEGSLVRLYNPTDLTSPIGEWLPDAIVPTDDKFDLNVDISGLGIKNIMSYARVEAYDWDGSADWVPNIADWLYGGPSILSNPTMEDGGATPTQYQLYTDATGGTFTLSDGVDTTSAIAFNASPLTVATRLETDIASITDVLAYASNGSAAATESNPFFIEFVTPQSGVTLTCNGAGLTGDTEGCTLIPEQVGQQNVSPWTCAQFVGNDICFGLPDIWEASTEQNHTPGGQWSIKVRQPSFSQGFAGAQQVITVTPGQTYQVSGWIYPTNASDRFGIIIKTLGEETVAQSGVPGTGGAALTANQWNEITITDVVIPEDITQVIVRVRQTDPGSTGAFYIDDVNMFEGQQATTVGKIMGDLYDDATTDHAGRIVWEDFANPGTPYLTLDFSDSVDSGGDAWFEQEISIKLWMRMTYLQVLDQFSRNHSIEWRVVPDDVEAGTWLLQIYNPGGMATDYTAAQGPAIQGGASDVRRSIRRYLPSATNHLVEGLGRITSRWDTTGLASGIGRIEGQRIDRQAPDEQSASEAALEDSTDAMSNASPYVYDLVNPQDMPLSAYLIGDVLTIHDPPAVEDTGRLIDVEIVDTPESTVFEVQFFPTTPAGS